MRRSPAFFVLLLTGCPSTGDTVSDSAADTGPTQDDRCDTPAAGEDWERDLLHTRLEVEFDDLTAQATITVAGSASTALSLEAQGLDVTAVRGDGCELDWTVSDGSLHVGVPAGDEDVVLTVVYSFEERSGYDGWNADGFTFLWPYFCGNLFPCHSDPADGLGFELSVRTNSEGQVLVYPASIPADAPSYQLAWVRGLYERLVLGTSAGGVELVTWYLSGNEDAAAQGTAELLAAWEWFEATLGPYPFGDQAGSVEVDWGAGAYGGMEHHPLSHVGSGSMGDRVTHIHEAAHGWFGGGIRIACWEDFVLSEGTVTYLTVRAITEAIGAEAGQETWAEYDDALAWSLEHEDVQAWPDGCGEVDILEDGLFSYAPYYRGAEFYRRYAELVGVELLDEALGGFFAERVGQAATMQEMMEHLHLACGEDPMPLAEEWLR